MNRPEGNHSLDEQKKTDCPKSGYLRQTKAVKPLGSGGKGRVVCGMEPLLAVLITEPPDADPHVRWCERRAAAPSSYSIYRVNRLFCLVNLPGEVILYADLFDLFALSFEPV